MNICIFSDTYLPQVNGVVTSIETLRQGLIKHGHNVYIVTVNDHGLKTSIEDNIIRISAVKSKKFDGHRLATSLNSKVIRKLKSWRIDVVHTQTEFTVGTIGRVYAKVKKIPLVHTYHTLYEDYMHYVTNGLFNKQAKLIARHITKRVCNFSREVIVPTSKIAKLLRRYRVKCNVYTLPTGVDLEKFYTKNFPEAQISEFKEIIGLKQDEFVITYIGRLAKEKDIDIIVKAFKMAQKSNKKMKLLIVGDGPLKNALQESSIDCEDIIFLGKVPWNQIPIYYNLSDIFVTASRSETQGLTVLEALASSTPVVCVDDESFEIVKDRYNGRKFDGYKELSGILSSLYDDRKMLTQLSNNAFNSIEKLSVDNFVVEIEALYLKVINNRIRRRKIQALRKRFWRK